MIRLIEEQLSNTFWNWFGDSKVRTTTNEPLVCYHATNSKSDFRSFRIVSPKEFGAHFGTISAAHEILDNTEEQDFTRIIPVYLKIENPLVLPDIFGCPQTELLHLLTTYVTLGKIPDNSAWKEVLKTHDRIAEELGMDNLVKAAPNGRPKYYYMPDDAALEFNSAINQYFISTSYDGIRYKNTLEDYGSNSWIIFKPAQIKSALSNSLYNNDTLNITESNRSQQMIKLKEEEVITMLKITENYNRREILKNLSLSTPSEEVNFLINNIFDNKYMKKIFTLLGREDNSDGYPLPGKKGINYKDASDTVKKLIINIIKQDDVERFR